MTDLSPKTFTFEQLQAPSAPPAGGQSFSFEELQGAAPKTFSFDELKGAPAALPPGQVKRGTPYAGSYMENLGQQFQAGLHDLAASGAAEVTTSSESYLRAIDKIDQLLAPPKRVDETVNSANDRQDAALNYAGEWMDNPDIALYARDPSQREAIRKKIEGGITAGVSGIVEQQQASSAIPQNPELEAAMKTGSTWEVFKAVVKNPSIALDVAVRSSPQMAAGIALTPLVGPMVGAGTASFLSETSSDFVSALQDAGINTKDKAAFEKAIHDPVLVAKAKELALQKGVPVALFDAISGKLAGKMIAPAKVAGKELGPLTREVANIAVQAPVQAGLGAAGEAIGQMAQTQGKVRDPIGVLLEAVGEFGGTVGEVPGMALATGRHFGGEKLPSPDEGAPLSEHGIATIMQGQGQVPPAGTQPPTGTPGTQPPAPGTEEHFVPKTVEELPLTRKEFKSWVLQGVSKEASSLAMAALLKREAAKKMLEKGDTMSAERLRNAAAADLKGAIELGFKMKPKPATGTQTGTETGTGVVPPVPPVAPPQTPPTTPPGAPGTPPVTPGTPPAPTPPPAPPTTVAPPTGPVAPVNPPVTPGTPPTVVEPGPTLPQGTPRKYYRTVDPTLGLPHVTNPLFRGQVFSMSKRELKATGDVESFAASHYPSLDPHVAHMKIYQINYDRDIIKLLQEAGFNTDGYEQWTDARIKDAAQALENYARNKGYSVIDFYHFLGDKGKHPLMDKMSQGKNIGIMLNKSFEPFVSRMSEKARGKSLLGGFLFDMSSRIASGISMWYGRPLLIEDFGEAHLFRVDPDINMLSVDMMLEAANKIIKAFMPKARVMLSVSNADKTPGKGDNAYGTFFGVEDGTVNIWMNPKYMNDEFNWRQTFLHEMGHAIAWYNFWDAGSAMQEMLLDAYQKFVLETETDVASAYLKVTNLKRMGQLIATIENGKPILDGSMLSSMQDTFSGWFDFDEWMAEGFSRWASSNEKPLTMLDKFFKSVADEIKKVLKLFGYEGVSAADPALTKFFESVQEKHAMGWPSSSPSAVLHGTLEGLKQSVAESGEYLGPDGPTPSPATIGMRKLSRDVISTADIAGVDKFNWWIKSAWGLLQIASKNQHIAGLQKFVQHMRAFHISKMEMVSRADFRLREWRKLGKEMATNLSKFMYAMDTMEYLPVGANMRWPTQAEFAALAAQYRLNARALALYDKMKGDFAHVLDRIEAAWLRDASATISDPIKLQQEINKIVKEMASMRSRPYFPHERFGDWTLTARVNGKVEFHQQFASRKQAEQAAVAYQRSNPGHEVTTGKLSSEGQQFRGLPPSLLKSIASRLSLTAQQRQALDDVILSLAPSNSAAKRFKRRSNTPGYSLDGMRSYATYFMTMSGHVARLEYNGVMTEDIKDVFASAKAMRGVFAAQGVSKRVGIGEWMQRLYDYMNSAKSEWQGLRSFAFIWYLGYNVSSALTNLTQVPMVALPYLSARFGDLKTVNELRKAYTDLNGVYRMKSGALKPELEDALKEAIKQGFIDESMAKELASAANGGTLIEALPGTSAQRALTGFSNVGAIPFQMIEKLNRRVTFVSAFRMAQQAQLTPGTGAGTTHYLAELARANDQLLRALTGQGWTQANAVAFLAGRDAVERSQFEYTKWARPAFMRGKLGTLFTFFMFKQNMLWFLKNSPGAGRAWLMLLAGAGVMGLPGAGDLDDLIKFLAYKLFGKDFDPKVEFRKYVQSLGADPDLVMHGLGYKTLGLQPLGDALGIPVPGIDLSSRIGMGEVIPGMHEATAVNSDSFEEKLGKVAEQLVGPAYGVPLTLLRAQSSQDPNEFKNLERQLPTAFKNLVRAYRYATEGETNRGGAQTTGFDMTDTKARMEVMAQALGFTPARIAARREASQAAYEATEYWALRRNEIFVQYAYAIRTKDREALARVRESLRDFNREAPMPKMRISVKDLLSSLKRRAKEKMKTERGLETPISRDMNKLYPLASPPPSN